MHPCLLSDQELLEQCKMRRERRSGPGGQHRNKVETAVVLTHLATGIEAEANERRSQAENRKIAVFRLRLALAVNFRTEQVSTAPTDLWTSRVRKGKIAVSQDHHDFPAILAEAIDHLVKHEFELPKVAESLNVTSSQLIRLLKKHQPAFEFVNRQREAINLHRLK